MQHTYTFAGLDISPAAFDEIHDKLQRVGDLDSRTDHEGHIDMRGLAVRKDERAVTARRPIAWATEVEHYGLGYVFSDEFIAAFPRFPLPEHAVKEALPDAKPPGYGIACTVVWTEIVQALRADGVEVGDKSGPAMNELIRRTVQQEFSAAMMLATAPTALLPKDPL